MANLCTECREREVEVFCVCKCLRCYRRNWFRQWRANLPVAECTGCGRERRIESKVYGWCASCLRRWQLAGRPEPGPPPLETAEERKARTAYASQVARQVRQLEQAIKAGGWHIGNRGAS